MFFVYILFSEKLNRYYIGFTSNLDQRLNFHHNDTQARKFTYKADDWILYFTLECKSKEQAVATVGLDDNFYKVIKQLQGELLKYGKTSLIGDTQTFEDSRKWKFKIEEDIVRDIEPDEIAIEYEKVLNYLIALEFVLNEDKENVRTDKYSELIAIILLTVTILELLVRTYRQRQN